MSKRINKSLMVATNISKIDGRKITFDLTLPSYFSEETQQEYDDLLEKLKKQMHYCGEVKIIGLSLDWKEEEALTNTK